MDQKLRRRRVCEKLALVPGKLDHATVVAFSVANRKKSLQAYSGKIKFQYDVGKSTYGSLALDARAKKHFSKSDMLRNFKKW